MSICVRSYIWLRPGWLSCSEIWSRHLSFSWLISSVFCDRTKTYHVTHLKALWKFTIFFQKFGDFVWKFHFRWLVLSEVPRRICHFDWGAKFGMSVRAKGLETGANDGNAEFNWVFGTHQSGKQDYLFPGHFLADITEKTCSIRCQLEFGKPRGD